MGMDTRYAQSPSNLFASCPVSSGVTEYALAAILGTCPAACTDRLRLPPEIDACPLFDSSPCVDHGWPPYATLKPHYAEEASVTSSSRQTDHITGWRNPSPFSGHWIAAVRPAADNPLCLFVQLAAILGTCPAACADRLRLPPRDRRMSLV
ncbi:hypothetical protein MRX96_054636 [Rhipicephalus microplus]